MVPAFNRRWCPLQSMPLPWAPKIKIVNSFFRSVISACRLSFHSPWVPLSFNAWEVMEWPWHIHSYSRLAQSWGLRWLGAPLTADGRIAAIGQNKARGRASAGAQVGQRIQLEEDQGLPVCSTHNIHIYIYLTLFDSATIVQASLAISTPGHPRPRISGHQSLVHQKKIAICHLSLVGWLITFQQQNSTYPRLGDFFLQKINQQIAWKLWGNVA